MSDPKDQQIVDDKSGTNYRISIDRTKIEKELQEKLEAEKLEKAKINDALEKNAKELEEMKKKNLENTTEAEKIKKELDEKKSQLAEIAMKEFDRKKAGYIDSVKSTGLEEEKIKEMVEKIKTPNDLDTALFQLGFLSSALQKAQKERAEQDVRIAKEKEDAAKAAALAAASSNIKQGGGQVNLNEKNKDFIYSGDNQSMAYRKAIDDLNARKARGDKEAEAKLNELWKLAIIRLKKNDFKALGIMQCPRCGAGIKEGEICPYCGFDPDKYIMKDNLMGN